MQEEAAAEERRQARRRKRTLPAQEEFSVRWAQHKKYRYVAGLVLGRIHADLLISTRCAFFCTAPISAIEKKFGKCLMIS